METPARTKALRLLQRLPRKRRDRPPPVADAPRRFRAVVAYDGTDYAGFQRQRAHVTVQEILEAAIETATCLPTIVGPAGRTDAGVHADGQVVSFDSTTALPAEALRHLCDHLLPEDVKVHVLEEAPRGFHPQHDALRKLYRYEIFEAPRVTPRLRRVAWRVETRLDMDAMRAAAALLVGLHDFRAFRSDPGQRRRGESTLRVVERIDVAREGEFLRIDTVGPGFLYMMVRNIAAVLVAVGGGERPPAWAGEVLASRERRLLPAPAPAHGLTLVHVEYADGFGDDARASAAPAALRGVTFRRRNVRRQNVELRITGRHTEHVDEKVKAYANEKLGPLSKYYDRTRLLELVLDEGKQGWKVEAIAHVQHGAPIVATVSHKDVLAAIDLSHDKLEGLLTREKDKRRTRRRGADGRAAAAPAAPTTAGTSSEEE